MLIVARWGSIPRVLGGAEVAFRGFGTLGFCRSGLYCASPRCLASLRHLGVGGKLPAVTVVTSVTILWV